MFHDVISSIRFAMRIMFIIALFIGGAFILGAGIILFAYSVSLYGPVVAFGALFISFFVILIVLDFIIRRKTKKGIRDHVDEYL